MNHTELQQPFFARFLESHNKQEQEANPVNNQWPFPAPTTPMKDPITEKWPSDGDEEF